MMLYQGQIAFKGSPQQLRETDDPIVKQFITGSSHGPIQVR